MTMITRWVLACCLVLAAAWAWAEEPATVALTPKWTAKQFAGMVDVEDQVLKLTNDERRKAGLNPVSASATLQIAARQHSQEMGAEKYFDHVSPHAEWRMPWQRAYNAGYWGQQMGENIVSLQNPAIKSAKDLAQQLVKLWMGSPPHRANILNADWTLLGVGAVKVGDTYYGTQLFAAPLVTLDGATVAKISGELVHLRIDGALRSGVINIWADGTHLQTVTPRRGAFSATVTYPKKTGAYKIQLGVGEQVAWEATLDTDKPAKEMLGGVTRYRAGVVTGAEVELEAFTGLHLTGVVRLAPGSQAYFIRDADIIDTLTAGKDGAAAFDCILPRRDTHYVIGIGYKNLREDLLYIDTTAPLAEAFLGRPER